MFGDRISIEGGANAMLALVYHGAGQKAWEEVPKPELTAGTGALKVALEPMT